MAATRLIAMHINKNHTLAECLKARTDYAANPEKTEKGELVTGYECDPMTCDEEFLLSKREYQYQTGRKFIGGLKAETNDVIAYQIRQSFKPGEVTAEEANRIGYETAMRFTKGKYAFIVATHTDKAHIHNHIVFNSTSLDCKRKFRDFRRSGLALQKVSDLVCIEHGLSVIEKVPYKDRKKRTEYPKRENFRDFICGDIDDVMKKKPSDFEEFLKMMEQAGYECKRGKHVAFRYAGQIRFIRMRSLGENYSEDAIRAAIVGTADHRTKFDEKHPRPERPLQLIKNIEVAMAQKGPGYARWATSYNLKQMSKTLLFIRDHNIKSFEELEQLAKSRSEKLDGMNDRLIALEQRLKENDVMKKHIINYRNTKDTYVQYRKAGYSKKFYEEHRQAITLHKAAKEYFDQHGGKLPSIKELNAERSALLAEKKQISATYYPDRTETREYLKACKNVEMFLDMNREAEDTQQKKEKQKNKKDPML